MPSKSEEDSKQEKEEDCGTEEVENVPDLAVPVLPSIENQDYSLQYTIAAVCDYDVGEGIGDENQPAVCTAADVAILNEAAAVDNATPLKDAAAVQGNELCWHALSSSFAHDFFSCQNKGQKTQSKTKNSSNHKTANVGLSIKTLCDQIGRQVKTFQDTSIEM